MRASRSSSLLLLSFGVPVWALIIKPTTSGSALQPQPDAAARFADDAAAAVSRDSIHPLGLITTSYRTFAIDHPFLNNLGVASCKGAAADIVAQTAIAHTALGDLDWERTLFFLSFNAVYSGLFLYAYQICVFRRLFAESIERFTTQPWADKLVDGPGLRSLSGQIALDIFVILTVYLPTFHVFREALTSGGGDVNALHAGMQNCASHFVADASEVLRVWLPADVLCFSLPLHWRLPVRNAVSFLWTTYYSVTRAMCAGP